MSDSTAPVRRPRAALVTSLTAVVLAALYVAGGVVSRRVAEDGLAGDDFVGLAVLSIVRPFFGDPFADFRTAQWLPWIVGVAVAVVVFWTVGWLAVRAGVRAAFLGVWFATMAATVSGGLVSARVWVDQNQLPDGSRLTDLYVEAVDLGLRWGFWFGWAPALVAALLAATLRTRPDTGPDSSPEHQDWADDPGRDEDAERLPSLSLPASGSSRG